MTKVEVVNIAWSQRHQIAYNDADECYELDSTYDPLLKECGLYCIYGSHPVYGPDVLLYIGKTKADKEDNSSFSNRLIQHCRNDETRFWYLQNLSYSTGVPYEQISSQNLLLIESILIAAHKPALNSQHIDGAKKDSENYLIRNWDFPGALQFECSGGYWVKQGKK